MATASSTASPQEIKYRQELEASDYKADLANRANQKEKEQRAQGTHWSQRLAQATAQKQAEQAQSAGQGGGPMDDLNQSIDRSRKQVQQDKAGAGGGSAGAPPRQAGVPSSTLPAQQGGKTGGPPAASLARGGPNDKTDSGGGSPESWGQRMRQQLIEAQQGGMSDEKMGGNAKKLWKVYEKKMEDLRMDLAMEMDPMSSFFFPIGIMGYALTDIASFFDGGTFTTIINWIVYIITIFVLIHRIKRYSDIQYRNIQRKIRRTQKLMHRAFWRMVLRLLVSIIEAVPILGLLPIWSLMHWFGHWVEKLDINKLVDIERMRADTEKRLKRVWANAQRRGGMNALKVAMTAIKAVQILDKKYDEV